MNQSSAGAGSHGGSEGPPRIPPVIPVGSIWVREVRVYSGVVTPLVAISTALLITRLVTRTKSVRHQRLEDWLITIAAESTPIGPASRRCARRRLIRQQVFAAVDWATFVGANSPVLSGPATLPVSVIPTLGAASVVGETMSAVSVPLIKISMAIMLLHLLLGWLWPINQNTHIGVQIVLAIFVVVMQCTRCIPLSAIWDVTVTQKICWSDQAFRDSLAVTSALVILTDFILSLIPLTFIVHIRRPLRERLMILFLMGLGLFASSASVAKIVILQAYGFSNDPAVAQIAGMRIALWSNIEEQLGIMAACLPCLKAFFSAVLLRLGLVSERGPPTQNMYPTYGHQLQALRTGPGPGAVRLGSTHEKEAKADAPYELGPEDL